MNDSKNDTDGKEQQRTEAIENIVKRLLAAGVIVAVIGISIFAWQQQVTTRLKADTSLLGDLGSFFSGTVGALWSLASVILFYLALVEQRKDIKINQKGLKLQIEELEETRTVYQGQSEIFKLQAFENTFFQLLQLHSNTVKDLFHSKGGNVSQGKAVFNVWKSRLDFICTLMSDGRPPDTNFENSEQPSSTSYNISEDLQNTLVEHYMTSYSAFENVLNHYFRQLYHIFKYIHLSPLIIEDRRTFYASLVRAQLSQNELYAIVYNSLIPGYGKPKFLFFIKRYDIVKNFNPSYIPSDDLWKLFNAELQSVSDPFVTTS